MLGVAYGLLLAYGLYFVARVAFLVENLPLFSGSLGPERWADLACGSLVFDTSAIMLTHIPFVLLMLLTPWRRVAWWVYMAVNAVALAVGLADAVYFKYTMRRTTTTVFQEFQHEGNLFQVVSAELLAHWYLVALFVLVVWGLYLCLAHAPMAIGLGPDGGSAGGGRRPAVGWQLLARLLCLVVLAPLTVAGIRGGFATAVRPITISNANQYAERPAEAALVLNTPFSLYRTIGKAVFQVPDYFDSEAAMDSIYTPIHRPDSAMLAQPFRAKNVVVLIVESFGREYIGALNTTLEQGRYRGYTPSIDSIIGLSTTFTHSYCNGRKSIDGMPSILSSIPMFVEPFFLTPASMNHVGGLASLLAPKGYATAFFHGAQRGSMGFMAFARATGFQHYYGREDYEADPRFGGSADFDGLWAIWDEPFLQYYCQKMTEMAEPFMTAVFTASSHHPYKIPERYRKQYPEEGIVMHKCIRYTDMALGRFFRTASRQPWFRNTVFVLTSDHTNLSDHPEYQTDLGGFCSPIVIYEPGREPSLQHKVAQQIDILPTVLGMLHYDRPYCAFGKDLLNTPADSTWAVNYLNGTYQYVKYGHVLQFDGRRSTALYALDDSLMQRNLLAGADVATAPAQLSRRMERQLQAIIQQYMARMTDDRLQP